MFLGIPFESLRDISTGILLEVLQGGYWNIPHGILFQKHLQTIFSEFTQEISLLRFLSDFLPISMQYEDPSVGLFERILQNI